MKYHKYMQGDIHALLKSRQRRMSAPEIAKALGIPVDKVSTALQGMRRKGCAVAHGTTRSVRWEAVGKPVRDGRGRSEGSEIGREIGQKRWSANLPKAWEARGLKAELTPKPMPGCALEDCWPVNELFRHWEKKSA